MGEDNQIGYLPIFIQGIIEIADRIKLDELAINISFFDR